MKNSLRLWLGAFTAFGTVAGHTLAYLIAVPDPQERSQLLAGTGHRFWDLLSGAALAFLVVGTAGFVLSRMAKLPGRRPTRSVLFRVASKRLVPLMCVAFVLLETVERVAAVGAVGAADLRVMVFGLLVQCALGFAIAGYLVTLAALVDGLTRPNSMGGQRCLSGKPAGRPTYGSRRRAMSGAGALRGPPSPVEPNSLFQPTTKETTVSLRKCIATFLAAALVLLASPAAAHVTANPNSGPESGFFTTFMRVPHGCDSDGPDTTSVSIQIPDGVQSVTPEDVPGWSVEVVRGPLAEPYESHGETITEGVKEVTYTAQGAPLDSRQFRQFGLSMRFGAEGQDVLYFPTVQRCEQGEVRWVNIPASLDEWGDTDDPSPYVELVASAGPDEPTGAPSASEPTAADSSGGDGLTYVAIGIGVLALLVGAGALTKSRKA